MWTIVAVVMIGYLGTAMPYPIFAPLFLSGDAPIARSSALSPVILYSLLMAVYPLGTVLGSVALGPISDRVGRPRVMLVTTLLAAAANAVSAYGIVTADYAILLAGRLLTGVCEGNISVARAALTDLGFAPSDRTVAFGYLGTASYGAYLVGPLVGGVLASLVGDAAPFYLAALLSVAAGVACWRFMAAPPPPTPTTAPGKRPAPPPTSLWRQPGLWAVLAVQFAIGLAINVYHEFFPVLLVTELGASPIEISLATMTATVAMILASVVGLRALLRRWSTEQLYLASMVALGISLALLTLPERLAAIYPLFVLFGVALAVFNGSSNSWLSAAFSNAAQGKLMGVVGSTFFAANIVAALLGGLVASRSIDLLMLGGGGLAIAAGVGSRRMVRRRTPAGTGRAPGVQKREPERDSSGAGEQPGPGT